MKALGLILIAASSLLGFTTAANAANEVIGTVEATLDGKVRTWYVLKADTVSKGGDSSAIWMQTDPDHAMICRPAICLLAVSRVDLGYRQDFSTGYVYPRASLSLANVATAAAWSASNA